MSNQKKLCNKIFKTLQKTMPKVANYNISLKCFLKNEKGEVLILKTPDDSSFHGKYDFPGGRIDEEEFEVHYADILKREILEETGIKNIFLSKSVVAIGRHKVFASERKIGIGDNLIFYIFFEGTFQSEEEEVTLSFEHQNFLWIKLEEIEDLEKYFKSGILEAVKMYLENTEFVRKDFLKEELREGFLLQSEEDLALRKGDYI